MAFARTVVVALTVPTAGQLVVLAVLLLLTVVIWRLLQNESSTLRLFVFGLVAILVGVWFLRVLGVI